MKILVVEDEPKLGQQIISELEKMNWLAEHALDGLDALYRATSESWDVIVLDLGLPKLDGLTVLKSMRSEGVNTPVIILSARDTLSQRIEGLNAGADDYLTKPFAMEELHARIKAQLRRVSGNASPLLKIGDLSLDTHSSTLMWKGVVQNLTAQEYKLMAYFVHHPKKVISRTELTEHIYKQDFDRDSNTIEVFIGRLRKKISPDIIKTVRGLGYRLGIE